MHLKLFDEVIQNGWHKWKYKQTIDFDIARKWYIQSSLKILACEISTGIIMLWCLETGEGKASNMDLAWDNTFMRIRQQQFFLSKYVPSTVTQEAYAVCRRSRVDASIPQRYVQSWATLTSIHLVYSFYKFDNTQCFDFEIGGPRNVSFSPVANTYYPGDQITCSADARPNASYTWTIMGTAASIDGSVLRLTFDMVGTIRCTVINQINGYIHEATGSLTVTGKICELVNQVSIQS